MNKLLAISIVIPVYNEARIITRCLNAIAAQTERPFEVIIVDNNSTDATVSLSKAYDFVTVVAEPRQGISYARTAGFNAATGDIIARIDADTVIEKHWVETLQRIFSDESVDAAGGNAAIAELSPHGRFVGSWLYGVFRFWHQRSIGVGPMLYGFNCAFRRRVWLAIKDDVTMDDSLVSEDVDVTCAIIKHRFRIVFSKEMVVKCPAKRWLDISKARRYYTTDNYTLARHRIGNPRRWKHAEDTRS